LKFEVRDEVYGSAGSQTSRDSRGPRFFHKFATPGEETVGSQNKSPPHPIHLIFSMRNSKAANPEIRNATVTGPIIVKSATFCAD
jgi:hypothetical protein